MKTTKTLPQIEWPADLDPDEGWPDESTPLSDGTGRTFGDLAKALGTTVHALCVRLGKPENNKEGA